MPFILNCQSSIVLDSLEKDTIVLVPISLDHDSIMHKYGKHLFLIPPPPPPSVVIRDFLIKQYEFGQLVSVSKCKEYYPDSCILYFFNESGDTIQVYNESRKELISYCIEEEDRVPVKIYSNQDSSYTFPDRPPMFKGGKKVLKNFVDQHIHYPTDAWQHDITGMISVSMKIDTMGHLSSYHLINRVYPSLDAEASRICRIIPDTWIPALVRGKKVESEYILNVNFDLR